MNERTKKVVWFEGMTLDPHHFQQWDRHHQSALNFRIRSISPYDWGIANIEVDKEALANGQFSLLHCSGVMPDNSMFDLPDDNPLPFSRNIQEHFHSDAETLGVYLGVPAEQPGGSNCTLNKSNGSRKTRYTLENIKVNDDNTGGDRREIGIGREEFQILFDNEPTEDSSMMKIAEIVRTPDGNFAMSDEFIPSCLSVSGSENLTKLSHRLSELLITKSTALSKGKRQLPSGQIQFATSDIAAFGSLHSINTFIPLLNHYHTGMQNHPEELYMTLLALAGQLMTFSTKVDYEFPPYNHNNLTECFSQLNEKVTNLLTGIIAVNYVSLPLERKKETLYVGRILDDILLQEAQFFVLTSGEINEKNLAVELPNKLRLASPETIDAVLQSMTQGLPIYHVSEPPAGLPVQPDTNYFRLETEGPYWEAINRSFSVAIFVPAEFKRLKIEFIAVR